MEELARRKGRIYGQAHEGVYMCFWKLTEIIFWLLLSKVENKAIS